MAVFVANISVANTYTQAAPLVTQFPVQRGTVITWGIQQQSGLANKMGCIIQRDGKQLFPLPEGSYIIPTSTLQQFSDFYRVDAGNPMLQVLLWNTDAQANPIEIVVTVIPPEDLTEMLGNVPATPAK
jgi:hypothetical protein